MGGGEATVVDPKVYTVTFVVKKAKALIESGKIEEEGRKGGSITTFVLRSDTILVLNDTILKKSADKASARDILGRLSGGWHEVRTVVCLYKVTTSITTQTEKVFLFVDTARVKFDTLDERDINAYVETEELIDKAESY